MYRNKVTYDQVIDKLAFFMSRKANSDYYIAKIREHEQPEEVINALMDNNFRPFLTYWNQEG